MRSHRNVIGKEQQSGISFGDLGQIAVDSAGNSLESLHQQDVTGEQNLAVCRQANFNISLELLFRCMQFELSATGNHHGVKKGGEESTGDGHVFGGLVLGRYLLAYFGEPGSGALCTAGREFRCELGIAEFLRVINVGQAAEELDSA